MQICFRHMRSSAFWPLRILRKNNIKLGLHPFISRISARQLSASQGTKNDDAYKTANTRLQDVLEERANIVEVADPSTIVQANRDTNRNQHHQKVTEVKQEDSASSHVYGSSEAAQEHGTSSIGFAMQNQSTKRKEEKAVRKHDDSKKHKIVPPHIGSARDLHGEWILQLEGKTRAARMRRPWVLCLDQADQDPSVRLSAEIQAFDDYMRPSPAESGAANTALSSIKDSLGSDYTTTPMGSRATGLETPFSDIDIGVHRTEWDFEALNPLNQRTVMYHRLLPLHILFRGDTNNFRKTKLLKSRVPVLTTVHRATDLEIQIQCQQRPDNRQEATKAYMKDMPSLRPLYHVLRHALTIRDLVGAREGGIGSYPLFVMIMTALQFLGQDYKSLDLGEQLLYVLKFWAELDTTNGAYAADPPRVLNKKKIKDEWYANGKPLDPTINAQAAIDQILEHQASRPYLLCLQDPADPSHDLGRNCHHIKSIQLTLKAIQDQLLSSMRIEMDETAWKLDSLVRADYQHFEWQRSKLAHLVTHPGERFMMGSFPKIYRNQDQRIAEFKVQKRESMPEEPPKPQPTSPRLETLFERFKKPFSLTHADDEALGFRRANPLAEPRGSMRQGRERKEDAGLVRRLVAGRKTR